MGCRCWPYSLVSVSTQHRVRLVIFACESAAGHGQLDTLRWLRENGCPWNVSDVCIIAAAYGFSAVFEYIIELGEVLDAELLADALYTAVASDNLQAAQWLRQHGAQWPAVQMITSTIDSSGVVSH
jgi:hypothetical protein